LFFGDIEKVWMYVGNFDVRKDVGDVFERD
jgi:hypothetical protein